MARYIEKDRAAVRVSEPGRDPMDGFFALAPTTPLRDGPETILDLLNSKQRVVPFIHGEDRTVLLLTRLNIDWVMAGPGVDRDHVCPRNYIVTREERVQVSFLDGRVIEGLIQMELPEDFNRASDFLNGTDDFFPLVTRLGTLIVNKARVRETLVFETSPRPAVQNAAAASAAQPAVRDSARG